MENIVINYFRLLRHYDFCLRQYDEVALLDLAHSLRVWMDMKHEVHQYIRNSDSLVSFGYHSITKPFRDLIKNSQEYTIAGFPGGVKSYVSNKEFASSNNELIDGKSFIGFATKPTEDGIILYFFFNLNGEKLSEIEREIAAKGFVTKEASFMDWLNSEAVRVQFKNNDRRTIQVSLSKEETVRRVANYLGGSHPKGQSDTTYEKNQAVEFLQNSFIGGLPSPYFIVLKIAKDILDNIKLESKYPRKK